MQIVAFLFNYTAEIDTRAYYILNTQQGIAPGGGETICPSPPMAVRRWQKSRRIYVRPRTGPQSAHLWWTEVAKLQAASVPIA